MQIETRDIFLAIEVWVWERGWICSRNFSDQQLGHRVTSPGGNEHAGDTSVGLLP